MGSIARHALVPTALWAIRALDALAVVPVAAVLRRGGGARGPRAAAPPRKGLATTLGSLLAWG
eukprot:11008464-Lingulodinium_polyedra.AAC.1